MTTNWNKEPRHGLPSVLVCGYPKSGNTWLSRLLGECLDSPVMGYKAAVSLATEGIARPGNYIVRQLHLRPIEDGTLLSTPARGITFDSKDAAMIFLVVRDPRDMALSTYHYWRLDSPKDGLRVILDGSHPLNGIGALSKYWDDWLLQDRVTFQVIRYEDLLTEPVATLGRGMLSKFGVYIDPRLIERAVERQSFERKRNELSENGHRFPYGAEAQLHNLWKGKSGEWRNSFTREMGQRIEQSLGCWMRYFNYTSDENWWQEL